MSLWLDMLRTPMAAPESAALRRLRLTWQGLCFILAASIIVLDPLQMALGRTAPCIIAVLLAATALTTLLYLRRKHRADTLYLANREKGE